MVKRIEIYTTQGKFFGMVKFVWVTKKCIGHSFMTYTGENLIDMRFVSFV